MTEEHRTSSRHRTLKSGRISFADGNRAVECQIRNLSLTGASLIVPTTILFPHSFTLIDVHGGTQHAAVSVWRRGERMGVRFTDVAEVPPAAPLPRAHRRLTPRHLLHAKPVKPPSN